MSSDHFYYPTLVVSTLMGIGLIIFFFEIALHKRSTNAMQKNKLPLVGKVGWAEPPVRRRFGLGKMFRAN